MISLCL